MIPEPLLAVSAASGYPMYWITSRVGMAIVKHWPLKPVSDEFNFVEITKTEIDADVLAKAVAREMHKQKLEDQAQKRRDEYVQEMDMFRGHDGSLLVEGPNSVTRRVDELQQITPEYEAYLENRRLEREHRRMGWSGTKAIQPFSEAFSCWQLEREVMAKQKRLNLMDEYIKSASISATKITIATDRKTMLKRKYGIP